MGRIIKVDFRKKLKEEIPLSRWDKVRSLSLKDWVLGLMILLCLLPTAFLVVGVIYVWFGGKR